MAYTRYLFAARHARGRDVLEVACGSGQGLGILRSAARRVVGGDYTESVLSAAQRHYRERVPIVRLDGHALPFPAGRFDLAVLYEAIYYLARPAEALAECRRVLRPGGQLIVGTVNCRRPGFNRSPFSIHYPDARELRQMLERAGFTVEMYGAYPDRQSSAVSRLVSAVRWGAVTLHLVPRTMKGKEALKRLFYGDLLEVPAELPAPARAVSEPQPLTDPDDTSVKVLYSVGTVA